MDSEGQEDDSLEKSNQVGLLRESSTRRSSSKVPAHRPARQLWLHAALMCGRDFLYAVEVVLVTPIMLQLGMPENLYSYIWFISPTFGLLLGPFMGNWSDKCSMKWGRRRPFILGFVVGTIIALTLMIFSKDLALAFSTVPSQQQTLGLVFGIIGTQTMDFCLDQLEAPLRAFTLDVCSPADQQRAFALQTLSMGLGAALGFIIDGIKWDDILGLAMQGLQIKVVYAFAIFVYLTTAAMTLCSIQEVQYKKPPKRKKRLSKSATVVNVNGDRKHSRTRKILSDPCVLTKNGRKNMKHGRSADNGSCTETNKCDETEDLPEASAGNDLVAFNSREDDIEESLHKSRLNTHHDIENGFIHPSPTIRSITLLPRISLCKSVFMTMSCPEGLNDITMTSSLATTMSLTTDDDDSSSDEMNDSALKVNQDCDQFGSSMPNLPMRDGSDSRPATFLEIIKDKLLECSSSMNNMQEGNNYENFAMLNKTSQTGTPQHGTTQNPDVKVAHFDDFDPKVHRFSDVNSNGILRPVTGRSSKSRDKMKRKRSSTCDDDARPVSTRLLWLSILSMPMKLRFLCFSLLVSFMGIEVLLLWYTNIFGSVVYGGDPSAPANSTELQLYNDGVHMGCWGLTIYALAVMAFSVAMDHFDILTKISLRTLYASGQLLTAVSTAVMFLFPNKYVILMLSWTIGITVSTTLTIPYVLVGKYHQDIKYVMMSAGGTKRGYGTDCAILACQMYAGNLLYAAISGPVISSYGGVKIMLIVASLCHTVAFFVCSFLVTYPGEKNFKFCCGKARTSNQI